MTSSRDITVSKIITPDVFRHTPFEHETTTDLAGSFMTTIDPTTVMMVTHDVNEGAVTIPSLPSLCR
jgi:hypothetical protein